MHVEFTKQYPKAPPRLEIEPLIGITQDNVVAMERKVDQLLGFLGNRPLVYDVVEAVRVIPSIQVGLDPGVSGRGQGRNVGIDHYQTKRRGLRKAQICHLYASHA